MKYFFQTHASRLSLCLIIRNVNLIKQTAGIFASVNYCWFHNIVELIESMSWYQLKRLKDISNHQERYLIESSKKN